MTADLQDLFARFADDPSPDHHRQLHEAVVNDPAYAPWSPDVREAEALLRAGEAERARERLVPAMAGWLLSPRAHRLLAAIHEAAGGEERDQAGREREVAEACVRAIRASGDGTAERPCRVTRVTDAFDVLGALGRPWTRHRRVERGGRILDAFELAGGGAVWFDATEAHRAQA